MLRSGKLQPEKTQKAFDTIERNVRAQGRLIDDLLDVSRIISGKLLIEPSRIEIAKVVEAAAESIGPAAEEKGVNFKTTLAPGAGMVLGDLTVYSKLSGICSRTPSSSRRRGAMLSCG